MNKHKSVSILGCGWYGLEFAKYLIKQGYSVKGSTTSIEKLDVLTGEGLKPYLVNFDTNQESYDPLFFDAHTLVVAIPPKRSSSEQASYPTKIAAIASAARAHAIKNVLFISSTAVYANSNAQVDESSPVSPETESGKAIVIAEQILQSEPQFKTTILRFAGLVGPGRDPGRFFAGKQQVPDGLSPINLIHLRDCIGLSGEIIRQDSFGHVFNGCAPHHPSKMEFYTRAARRSGFPEPSFVPELGSWKTVSSANTSSLLNYKYLINNWTDWLSQDKL